MRTSSRSTLWRRSRSGVFGQGSGRPARYQPAIRRRKPDPGLLIHSDQGAPFASRAWATFLRKHGLEHSMSRRGNYHDNAVAGNFFQLMPCRTHNQSG
ncbi:MAG: transposase family protein [Rhodobacteraceae bacterium]|nr:transposase family protein [Paracoccaceae bacterium]